MALDPYALCPCGSGKKLKWCCQALAADMERIEKIREKGQHEAALRAVTEVGNKHPGNAWTTTTRALLLMNMDRREEMVEEIRSAVEQHPENARVVLLNAMIEAQEKGAEHTMPLVQRALQRAAPQDPALGCSLATMVGVLFIREGHPFAALQHLTLGINLNPQDEKSASLLHELMGEKQISLFYKEDYRMQPATLDGSQPDWAGDFNEACALAGRGSWLAAIEAFENLKENAGDSKSLWYNLGICEAALGRNEKAAEALRRYTALETNHDDAVETEALAELLAPEKGETIKSLTICYSVKGASALKQALESDPRFLARPTAQADGDVEEGPSPETSHYEVLDRPRPEYSSDLGLGDLPSRLGFVSLNDPPDSDPELILIVLVGERADQSRKILQEAVGEALGEAGEPEEGGEVSKESAAMSWQWAAPKGISPVDLHKLMTKGHKHLIEEVWIDLPQARFGGKSPREASGDSSFHTRLLANILLLELENQQSGILLDPNPLREQLGLPRLELIDIEDFDVDQVPLARMHRILVDRLTDDELVSLSTIAVGCSALSAVERFSEELTRRPGLKDQVDLGLTYTTLSDFARQRGDRDRALEWIDAGRSFDREQNETNRDHEWDLLEILTRLTQPDDEQLEPAVKSYFTKHRDKPDACQRLLNLLVSVGAVRPEQLQAAMGQPERAVPKPASEPGIWTPGGESPEGEKVKIWTPGDA